MMTSARDHDELDTLLADHGLARGAAESDGLLAGLLTGRRVHAEQVWLDELADDAEVTHVLGPELRGQLHEWFEQTEALFEEDAITFEPLLPDDDEPIGDRVAALVNWTSGFLYGLAVSAAFTQREQLTTDAQEIIANLGKITQADEIALTNDEAHEQAFMQIVEFLRVAVAYLHGEFASRTN
ncbi:MAG: UPF0149 family protein [Chromatiales bacterium]|nr:UPF0149 family protein [Chromatiales bacterium]